jgi:hypothetical protein
MRKINEIQGFDKEIMEKQRKKKVFSPPHTLEIDNSNFKGDGSRKGSLNGITVGRVPSKSTGFISR